MLDFGLLPPEVTSTRLYAGPGSGSLTSAAAAWAAVAAELESFAHGYSATVAGLLGEAWAGTSSEAMAAAATPFVQWATETAARAGRVSGQAQAAAGAFEAAHAAITPPAVVSANRTRLTQLIATNALGQNTAHIAATEAAYDTMWVHNSQTMTGYASSASAATQLSAFHEPPQTTNPGGAAGEALAAASGAHTQTLSQLLATVPQLLSGSASNSSLSSALAATQQSALSTIGNINTADGPVGFWMAVARTVGNLGTFGIAGYRLAADGALYAPLSGLTGSAGGVTFGLTSTGMTSAGLAGAVEPTAAVNRGVLAHVGTAGSIGPMTVPPAWADLAPAGAATEDPVWLADADAAWDADDDAAEMGGVPSAGVGPMAGMAGAATAGMTARPIVSSMLRVAPKRFTMPRHSAGG
ncbi:PPE family protein [Mycobacterium sp. M1]|uniref:PPE family protein n=1 Tax=Mycolicibacter acidiphilus TaxID=2835306 RepID=A0ABS5RHK0_9MYCO|nr:PPE family protein [Mycolicibacter acidiphilus]MBS9532429.1 PPE family protein [Mycolicibacter acidiphilus]